MKKGIGPLALGAAKQNIAAGSMALLGRKRKRKAVKGEASDAYVQQRERKLAEKEAFKLEQAEITAGERASFYEQKPAKMDKSLPRVDRKNKRKANNLRDQQSKLNDEAQQAKENLQAIYNSQGVPRNERTTVQRMDAEGKGMLIPGSNRPSMTGATNPYKKKKGKVTSRGNFDGVLHHGSF